MANEVRLIDANALMERFRIVAQSGGAVTYHVSDICAAIEDEAIEESVDAVEVVRCAKCKHYQQYHKGRTEELCEFGKCKLISMDIDMPSNGFCCFGERRTNEPV